MTTRPKGGKSTDQKKARATPGGVAGKKSGKAADPEGFAFWCATLGTVSIGKLEFPIDIPAIDLWIDERQLPERTLNRLQRKRAAAVHAYLANDPDAGLEAIEDLHTLVHLLRSLPLAQSGARLRATNSAKRKGKGTDKEAVKRFHASLGSDHDATSQTAAHFVLSTRRVREILAE